MKDLLITLTVLWPAFAGQGLEQPAIAAEPIRLPNNRQRPAPWRTVGLSVTAGGRR